MRKSIKINLSIFSCYLLCCYGCETCDPSIGLGSLPFSDNSRSYFSYNGTEPLAFLDEQGLEHQLTSTNGIDSAEYDMIVATLCDAWPNAPQNLYYRVQSLNLEYSDSLGNQIRIGLHTNFEDTGNADSVAIFDWLEVGFVHSLQGYSGLSLVTEQRQNMVSTFILGSNSGYNSNRFVGDTTLFGRPFIDVFTNGTTSDYRIFYTKKKGLIAIAFAAGSYWLLKE